LRGWGEREEQVGNRAGRSASRQTGSQILAYGENCEKNLKSAFNLFYKN
jgi:hypothetical protein